MLKKMTDNVYYTTFSVVNDRPTMGYVTGKKYNLMVEAGNSKSVVDDFNADLAEAGFAPADYVVLSHHHWDHTYGLPYLNALSFALDKTNDILDDMSHWQWNEDMFKEHIADNSIPLFCEPHIRLEYPDITKIQVKKADISFHEEMTFDLGDQPCIFKKMTTPHTDESIVIYIPNEGIVFFGDALSTEVIGEEWIDNKEKLTEQIKEVETIDFKYGLEGHFPPKTKEIILQELKDRLKLL